MTSRQMLSVGQGPFHVCPWHADPGTAHLTVRPPERRPSLEVLHSCLRRIADAGYSSVITSALHPDEARSFLTAGFEEYDRLLVLSHDLRDLDPPRPPLAPGTRLRRARRGDRRSALVVDGRAFPPFWRLDLMAMSEAERATPSTRFRVAVTDGHLSGYAITGRGDRQGFLQRLATDPGATGRGVGSELALDALRWAARRRCIRLLVNTQEDNGRALELYHRIGFTSTATHLVVLRRPIP